MAAPVSVKPRQVQRQVRRETPGRHRGVPGRPHVPLRPCAVVAIWAALLALLVATSAGFGNNALVLELSGASAAFVLLLAGAVWLHRRLRPDPGYLRQPTRVGGVVMLSVAVALLWLGYAFGAWLMMIAVVPFLAAAGLEFSARRQGKSLRAAALAQTERPAPRSPGYDRADVDTLATRGAGDPPGSGDREPALSGAPR
jgi:hypothetical protein